MLTSGSVENPELYGIIIASVVTFIGLGVAAFILWWPVLDGTNTQEMLFLYIASGVVVLAAVPVWLIFYFLFSWILAVPGSVVEYEPKETALRGATATSVTL